MFFFKNKNQHDEAEKDTNTCVSFSHEVQALFSPDDFQWSQAQNAVNCEFIPSHRNHPHNHNQSTLHLAPRVPERSKHFLTVGAQGIPLASLGPVQGAQKPWQGAQVPFEFDLSPWKKLPPLYIELQSHRNK